jgi:hypothetical protein
MSSRWIVLVLLGLGGCSKEPTTAQDPSAPASTSSAASGTTLPLGKDTQVTSGQSYRVGDVEVSVRRISMANVVDDQGRENHELRLELVIEHAGKSSELELSGDQPREAAGLIFRADALGFQWGKSPASATLRVDRK